MESLKEKMLQLREGLEKTRDRAEFAEQKLMEANDRLDGAEDSIGSLNRRIRMTQFRLDQILENLESTQGTLETTEKSCNKVEEEIQRLVENSEGKSDKEHELELQVKEANNFETAVQMEYEAACRKLKVTDLNKNQVEQRIVEMDTSENKLTNKLKELTDRLGKLRRERSRSDRDLELETKISSLKKKCLEADLRREAAERNAQRLVGELCVLEDELEDIDSTKTEAKTSLTKFMDDMNTA